ncbi:MAG: hypothetical protein MUF05_00010 [Candidatus Omnitrophica bacterium]|jgi:hypothetical protein|nr:hypothetical protein [Candidatus Omnitrophota bacterium]
MTKRFVFYVIFFIIFFSASKPGVCFDDGFGFGNKINGRYFTIYCADGVDPGLIVDKLNVTEAERILAGYPGRIEGSSAQRLAAMVDILFLRACNILEMNVNDFSGILKVCRDQQHLQAIYNKLFEADISAPSFYTYTLNTIYIASSGCARGILGHEIAHAVTSNFFVVQPSHKTAEILSGYVEYQLRKSLE